MSPDNDSPDWFHFVAWFEGTATPEERAVVEEWIRLHDPREIETRKLRLMWRARRRPFPAVADEADAIEEVMASIQLPGTRVRWSEPAHRQPVRERRPKSWGAGPAWRAAAAVVLLLGAAWILARMSDARRAADTGVVAAVPAREITTRRGERATFDLVDGTRVVLAPESRLRVPAAFNTITGIGARDLELDGEAQFEVTHDATRPFRVRTSVGIAEDLGTKFVVSSYRGAQGMRVVVTEGLVAIQLKHAASSANDTSRGARPLALLSRGDLAQLDSLGAVSLRRGVDTKLYTAWTSGVLVFRHTPMREALAAVMRWHDVEIRLGDEAFATQTVTAKFDGTSIQDIVQFLALALNTRAEWRGRVVTFVPREAGEPGEQR